MSLETKYLNTDVEASVFVTKIMEEVMRNIYYATKNAGGYGGKQKLRSLVRRFRRRKLPHEDRKDGSTLHKTAAVFSATSCQC